MAKQQEWVEPIVLEGRFVRLEPLAPKHAGSLAKVAEPDLFKYFATLGEIESSPAGMRKLVDFQRADPVAVPFAIVPLETRKAVGMTSYMDIRVADSGLEIGRTWVGRPWQGTPINPECKLLLLEHAFERLGAIRVQLKTDGRNLQSQRAIEKLGACKEGVLRRHIRMPDGFMRDTVMYSITSEEWPKVKAGLLARLAAL